MIDKVLASALENGCQIVYSEDINFYQDLPDCWICVLFVGLATVVCKMQGFIIFIASIFLENNFFYIIKRGFYVCSQRCV